MTVAAAVVAAVVVVVIQVPAGSPRHRALVWDASGFLNATDEELFTATGHL